MLEFNKIYLMDVLDGLKQLSDNSIDAVVTSPPYNKLGLSKGKKQQGNNWDGYIKYENFDDNMPEKEYQQWQVNILNEIKRVLKPNGSLFYNHKNRRYNRREYSPYEWISKSDLNLFQTIIWNRKFDVNNNSNFFQPVYELIFWLNKDNSKSPTFYKKQLKEQKSIWSVVPKTNLPHPAPFPEELVEQCILAITKESDVVLDPFMGIGTTAVVCKRLNRQYIGFDISEEYVKLAEENVLIGKVRKTKELTEINTKQKLQTSKKKK
jgi:site-specific DNA-methyltransferase (adenine-specific)